MRAVVDFQESRRVDLGVALGGRERGVTEQLLDASEIGAGAKQVGGEGVAQGVRRRALGQAPELAQGLHPPLHRAGAQRPAALGDTST